jgi:amidohydrolase
MDQLDMTGAFSPTDDELRKLIALRHDLHRQPELSGEERDTAERVLAALSPTRPDRVLTGLGGHGVAAIYDSNVAGPTVLFRSELDALPIQELGDVPHRSTVPGKAHLCGHDGHSTILVGFAHYLGRQRPRRGRVVLLFQPAEEDGSGAAAVIADPRFAEIRPDYAFSLHNAPGLPLGVSFLSDGPTNCASSGLKIQLTGSPAHASQPENGRSPLMAVAHLLPALQACGTGGPLTPDFSLVTVTHARMGEPVFGIAPGYAEIRATLRTVTDDRMAALCAKVEHLVNTTGRENGLAIEMDYADVFQACTNDPDAVSRFRAGLDRAGLPHEVKPAPQRGSEDFGRFGAGAKAAMLYLGAGTACEKVHTPAYDFPDALIPIGVQAFAGTLAVCLDANAP